MNVHMLKINMLDASRNVLSCEKQDSKKSSVGCVRVFSTTQDVKLLHE